MMKKLLILMLVLGMASMASAKLVVSDQTYYFQMDVSGGGTDFVTGDTITIDISVGTDATGTSAMFSTVLNISDATSIGTITQSNAAHWITYVASTSADGGGFNVNVDGAPIATGIPTGDSIYSVSFVAGAPGVVTIDATSGNWDGLTAVTGPSDGFYTTDPIYGLPYAQVTVIPEPMTIALLGLGGLVLLRRRK